jgi:chemotaxis family two-component system sensor kinase Cph1
LPLTYEESAEYKNVACGLLCMKLPTLNDAYLIFYRKESIQKVEWGGNPYSQMNITANQYAPRQSFERWLETVTDFSLPWTEHDLNIAEFIRTQVVNSLSVNAATRLS